MPEGWIRRGALALCLAVALPAATALRAIAAPVPAATVEPRCRAARAATTDLDIASRALRSRMAYPPGGGIALAAVLAPLQRAAPLAQDGRAELRLMEQLVYSLGDHHAHLSTNDSLSPRLVPSGASLWVEARGGQLVLTEVRTGSPARLAGLREGMVVATINGLAPERLIGPPATPGKAGDMRAFAARVALAGTHTADALLATGGPEPMQLRIEPQPRHDDPPVTLDWPRPDIARLRLNNSLGNDALPAAFDAMMASARSARTILLDLRDTPSGGDAEFAKPVMAWFIAGTRPYQKHQRGQRSWLEQVQGRADGWHGQLLVLVDRWTGSMGEGTAIGLQAAAGATLVGTRMAGLRGAIEAVDLPCLGVALRFPVERLFTVQGEPREQVQPDVLVEEAALAASGLEDAILARALALAASD
jgi:carboxyl-terminal processing protease